MPLIVSSFAYQFLQLAFNLFLHPIQFDGLVKSVYESFRILSYPLSMVKISLTIINPTQWKDLFTMNFT